jgi:hypothetical protein
MKLLNIISTGYRATVEEQDDTTVWLSHALRNAGAEVDLLLRGTAVNYPLTGQAVRPATIGGRAQKHGADVHGQLLELRSKGSSLFVLEEDVERRGLDPTRFAPGIELVAASRLPELIGEYDLVWHW